MMSLRISRIDHSALGEKTANPGAATKSFVLKKKKKKIPYDVM